MEFQGCADRGVDEGPSEVSVPVLYGAPVVSPKFFPTSSDFGGCVILPDKVPPCFLSVRFILGPRYFAQQTIYFFAPSLISTGQRLL